jgi:hypothetical protein
MNSMSREPRVIDYDKIEEWSPWLDEVIASTGPKGLIDVLGSATPEYLGDARDHLVAAVGRDRLVDHLNRALEPHRVRVFHGTRVTPEEMRSIAQHGLRALKLSDRRDALAAIFSEHPEWADKARLLDEELHRFGPGWEKAGAGKREDNSVHVCLSRAGLLYGCNHYLTHGAEVDQHIAQALFPGDSGLDLLARARRAKIVSFTAPFPDAARAANPYGFPSHDLPALIGLLISAWAFRLARPTFTVVSQRETAALRFPALIGPERIERIEDIDDVELQRGRR